ncbi:hypothetical protein HDU88_003243 [Geranomyces variabilis]|nr:hypothetical protein HDU88_003243 [Geranomyces variabilis]
MDDRLCKADYHTDDVELYYSSTPTTTEYDLGLSILAAEPVPTPQPTPKVKMSEAFPMGLRICAPSSKRNN